MLRREILFVLFVTALILTFSSTRVVRVFAQGSPALTNPVFTGTEDFFYLSGKEIVEHDVAVDAGDTFSMDYTVGSFNDSICAWIDASFYATTGVSHPYFFVNRTVIPPHDYRTNGTSYKTDVQGRLTILYQECTASTTLTSIIVHYSMQTTTVQSYLRSAPMWAPALVGLFMGGFGLGYLAYRFRSRKFQRSTMEKQSTSTSPSPLIMESPLNTND